MKITSINKKIDIEDVKKAVNELVDFVKPTYGPKGYSVIISDEYRHVNLDDGASIAEEYESSDSFINAIIKSIKEIAIKMRDRVGDGTTGSLIIAQAILNSTKEIKDIKKAALEAKEQLLKMSKEIKTKEELKNVAKISFNNEEMSKIISEIVFKVGQDGIISVEESNSLKTSTEIADGLRIDRGYISPYMITDVERMEAVLENPAILITNSKISSAAEILPALEKIINSGKKDILIIAEDIESEALKLLIVNKLKGIFNVVAVKSPGFGEEKNDLLEDICCLTKSSLVSEEKGIKLVDVKQDTFGSCRKAVITKDNTTIIGGSGNVEERINQLKTHLKEVKEEYQKEKVKNRIAKLKNGVALIKVGASTEAEMKKLKLKVENSVNSTKLAFRSGVVPG
ncbi:MAG: chaperonin GroEL, partial [Methanogenium sp.]